MDAAGHAEPPIVEEDGHALGVTPSSTGDRETQRGQNHRRLEEAKKRNRKVKEDKEDNEEEENALFSALEDLAEVVAADLSKGRVNQVVELLKAQQHAISSSTTDLVNSETGEIYAAPAVLLARASVCTMLCAALSRSGRHKEALRQGLDACIQVEWLWTSLLNAEEEEEQQNEEEQNGEPQEEEIEQVQEGQGQTEAARQEEASEAAATTELQEHHEHPEEDVVVAGVVADDVAREGAPAAEGEADAAKEGSANIGGVDGPKDAVTEMNGDVEKQEEHQDKEGDDSQGNVNGNKLDMQECREEAKEKKEDNQERAQEENKEKVREESAEKEKNGNDNVQSAEPQQEAANTEENGKEESKEEDRQVHERQAKEEQAEETKKEESKEDVRPEEESKEHATKEVKFEDANKEDENEEKKEEDKVKVEDKMSSEEKQEEETKKEEKEEGNKEEANSREAEDNKQEADKNNEEKSAEEEKKEEWSTTKEEIQEEEKRDKENKEEEIRETEKKGEDTKAVENREGEHEEEEKKGDEKNEEGHTAEGSKVEEGNAAEGSKAEEGNAAEGSKVEEGNAAEGSKVEEGKVEEENKAEGSKVEEKTAEENREEEKQEEVSKEQQNKQEEDTGEQKQEQAEDADIKDEENEREEGKQRQEQDDLQAEQQQTAEGMEEGAGPGAEAATQEVGEGAQKNEEQKEEVMPTLEEDDDLFADLPSDAKRLLTRVAETSLQGRHCVALELEFLAGRDMSFAAEAEISRLHAEGANIARTCLDEEHPARVLAESALKEWQRRIGGVPELQGQPADFSDGVPPCEPEGKSERRAEGSAEPATQPVPEQNRIVYPHTLLCSFARKVNTAFAQRSAAAAAAGPDTSGAESKAEEGVHDEGAPPPPTETQDEEVEQPQQEQQLQPESADAQALTDTEAKKHATPSEQEEEQPQQRSQQQGVTLPPVGPRRPGSDSFRRSATSGNLVKQRVSLPTENSGELVEIRRPKMSRSLTDGVGLPELARTTSSINADTLRATWPNQDPSGKKGHQQGKKTKGRMRLPSLSGGPSVSSSRGGLKSARSTRGDTESLRPRLEVDIFTDWRKHDMGTARSLPSQVLDTEGGIVYFTRKLRHESATFKQVTLRDAMAEDLRNPEGKKKLDMVRYCTEGQRVAMRRHLAVEARRQERERIAMPLEAREKRKEQVRQLFTYYKVGFAGAEPTLRDFTRLMATSSPAEKERKKREEEFKRQREYAEKLAWQRMLDEAQAQRRAFLGAAFGGGGRSPSKRKVQPKRASMRPSVRPPSTTPGRRPHAMTT